MVATHYAAKDGLPVDSTYAATIDSQGFLWLATHDGLARFDGRHFSIFDAASSPRMSDNWITDLFRDPQRRVYALASNGDLLSLEHDGVGPALAEDGAPLSSVRFVQRKPLCVTQASGVSCADGKGRFVRRMSFESGLGVAAALAAPGHGTWIIVPGRGIWLQLPGRRRTILADGKLQSLPRSGEMALVDRAGDLWAVLGGRLLHARQNGSVSWPDAGDGRAWNISQLRNDPDGHVWVGAEGGVFRAIDDHLVRVDLPEAVSATHIMRSWRGPDGRLWSSDEGAVYRDGSVVLQSAGLIEDIYFDQEGTVWISTLRDGFYMLTQARIDVVGKSDGLVEDNLYGVDHASDGTLWVGSLGVGGIQAIHQDGRVEHFGTDSGLPGLNTWVVAVAPNGDVYTATYAPGLYRKPAAGRRFERVPLPQALPGAATVRVIDFDPQGRLWIGSSAGAWRRDGGTWQRIGPGLETATIGCIMHAADGSTWLGGDKGLWRLSGNDADRVAVGQVGGAFVRNLFQDRDGTIWASTAGHGLIRIVADGAGHIAARRLGRAQGLPSNSPHAVLQDASGNLWVNSNQGIFRIAATDLAHFIGGQHAELSPLVLGRQDGLQDVEGNGGVQPASAIDGNGDLLFPMQHGLARIDPHRLPLHTVAPPSLIEGLDGDGRTLAPGTYDPLPQGLRSIQIRYGAIDLHAGERVRFRYRLMPIQEQWIDAGSQRVASFVALSPGRYLFEVVAGNGDGFWSRSPASVQFYIPPRWYEAAGNRAFAVAALALVLAWLVWHRARALKSRAAALDAQVCARTSELAHEKAKAETALADLAQTHRQLAAQAERLEAMDAFRTRLLADVSHELRTPLMLVQLALSELEADDGLKTAQQRRRILQSIEQSGRLKTLVEQLIGLAQAEAGQVRLRLVRSDMCEFVRTIAAGLQPAAERAGVRLDVSCDLPEAKVFIDRDRLTTVLGNLIDNACRYAPPGTSIGIHVATDIADGCVRVTVSARGPGIPQEVADHLFERFFRLDGAPHAGREGLGIGLALARELVDLHGGRIGAHSVLGEGARFWFDLPTGSAHVALEDLALEEMERSIRAMPSSAAAGEASAGEGDEGILLVEDHPDLASYLRERLSQWVPVACAGGTREAWQKLERQRPSLVIIDVVLPDGSGISLCRQIRLDPRFERLPVLLMSARATESDQREGLRAGAMTFLSKPFSFDELLAAIVRGWPVMGSIIEHNRAVAGDAALAPMLGIAQRSLQQASFGITEWAEQAHLSERQLRRRVIDLTGMAPQAWLREQRLLRVHQLVQGDACRTLAEAGVRAGIENSSYLYRLYRERFGQMPRRNTMT
ncbi:MAG: ATP-binding protein [Rhodanobacter sp.]